MDYKAFFQFIKRIFNKYPKGYFFDMNVYFMLNLRGISNNFTIFGISLEYLAFYAKTRMYGMNPASLLWDILVILNFCLNKKIFFCREFKNLPQVLSFYMII